MDPQQALAILAQLTMNPSLKLSRQEFGTVDQALTVLQQAIAPPTPIEEDGLAAASQPPEAQPEPTPAPKPRKRVAKKA